MTSYKYAIHQSAIYITYLSQGVISGIVRGAGRQLYGAIINFIAYYVIGLPLGIPLALATDLGIMGMWIGLLCASVTQALLYIVLLCCMNWEKESEKAMKLARTEVKSEIDKEGETELNVDAKLDHYTVTDEIELQTYKPVSQELEEVDLNEDGEDDGSIISEDGDTSSLVPNEPVLEFSTSVKWKIKSLLSHGAVFVAGVVLLIAAGIASQYHIPDSVINGNYSECTDNVTDDNY